ncbi:MAG: tetratricopeptide repeat protein [Anaerolineae bacterium]|nr:tetratricopeptide repeat protein [Anaerolineae bacterium]
MIKQSVPFSRITLIAIMIATVLTACGSQLTYQAIGSAEQAEVSYVDSDGQIQIETVSLPWEVEVSAGSQDSFSMTVSNRTGEGTIGCNVLLDGDSIGTVDEAHAFAQCEGTYEKGFNSRRVNFSSRRDILVNGEPAITPTPTTAPVTPAPFVIEPGPIEGGSNRLIFSGSSSSHWNKAGELFIVEFDEDTSTVTRLTDGFRGARVLDWSPDGSQLLYGSRPEDASDDDLFTLDLFSTSVTHLLDWPDSEEDYASWSPDGTQIVFQSDETGENDIYIMNSDGSEVTNLTQAIGQDRYPHWSPDGTTIYFTSERMGGDKHIYAMAADGSDLRPITTEEDIPDGIKSTGYDLSPDGSRIAFGYEGQIHIINSDGSQLTNLDTYANHPSFSYSPSYIVWSPNGQMIAFVAQVTDRSNGIQIQYDILVVNADGTNLRRLTDERGDDETPAWSADSQRLLFQSDQNNKRPQIYVVDLTTMDPPKLISESGWTGYNPYMQPPLPEKNAFPMPETPLQFGTPPEPELTAQEWYDQGVALFNQGRFDEALTAMSNALELEPDAGIYHDRGAVYYNMGEYEQAIADFKTAVELSPSYRTGYLSLAKAYNRLAEYELAVENYSAAIELDDKNAVTISDRGVIYYNLEDYEAALADFARAVELDPEYARAYNNLGETYRILGNYEQALENLNKSLELDPASLQTLGNRAQMYVDTNDYEPALADYSHAIELVPDDPFLYRQRGLVYEALESYDEAIADFDQSISLNPESDFSYMYRGRVYAATGETELAVADLRKALELTRNDSLRQDAIAELEALGVEP